MLRGIVDRLKHTYWAARDVWDVRGELGVLTTEVALRKAADVLCPTVANSRRLNALLYGFFAAHVSVPPASQYPPAEPVEEGQMRVWTLWWQGIDKMPPIIQATIESKRRHLPYPVVVIDQHNVGEYLELPPYVLEKVEAGKYTLAALSDVIRFSLLAKYGGLWVDATIYVLEDKPRSLFEREYYTLRRGEGGTNISQRRWAISWLGTNRRHSPAFEQLSHMELQVWQQFDRAPEYFATDYLTAVLYEGDARFRTIVEEVPEVAEPHYYDLEPIKHLPYDAAQYARLAPATMYYVSYRLPEGFNPDAPGTYLRRVIEGRLPGNRV